MSIKILLVDDHKIILDGLRVLIEKEPGMEVVAEAENGRTALKLTGEFRPNVIVMDINMPDLNGIDATRQIVEEFPGTKVIAFSMYSDRQFVIGMLKAGVTGYLLKDHAFEELVRAIRTVVENKAYICPEIAGTLINDYKKTILREAASALTALTGREREVLQLLAEGRPTRQIADGLNVSVKTVETHRRNIMGKLNIYSVAELTKLAIKEGLTSLHT
jgi:DNA-binding NarL/FixJ family response regulator